MTLAAAQQGVLHASLAFIDQALGLTRKQVMASTCFSYCGFALDDLQHQGTFTLGSSAFDFFLISYLSGPFLQFRTCAVFTGSINEFAEIAFLIYNNTQFVTIDNRIYMAYRIDKDLEFLGELESEDLNDLVYIILYDKDDKERYTEELTKSISYFRYKPDHIKYWKDIAAEIQCFGANSIATIFRGGEGVLYKEVLCDVASKLKVNFNKESSVQIIEDNLLMKVLKEAIDQMSPEQIKELANSIGVTNLALTKEALIGTFQTIFRAGGFKSYQLTVIIVNLVLKALIGRGLSFAATGTLMRTMSILSGPIGWAVTGAWTAVDIASPAYRVTIPAVIQIAFLRKKYLYAEVVEKVNFS